MRLAGCETFGTAETGPRSARPGRKDPRPLTRRAILANCGSVLTQPKPFPPSIAYVVDDEREAELIGRGLEAFGLGDRGVHLRSGQQALDFFLGGDGVPPSREPGRSYFVLLDSQLSRGDGVEVLGRFKAHPDLRAIPVFMLTGPDDPRTVERCHQLGCNGCIQKPKDSEQLAEIVHHLGCLLSVMLLPAAAGGARSERTR